MLNVENLCHTYNLNEMPKNVLNKVSFELKNNEILGILGTSGSGKSTLVQILSGLIKPCRGKILLDQKNIFDIKNLFLKISIVLQNPEIQLFSDTVYDCIAFGLRNAKYDDNKIEKIVNIISNMFNFDNKILKNSPLSLSGGIKRKCAIASAVALGPDILILDEPTAGLDYFEKLNLLKFAKNYKNVRNCSVIIISHEVDVIFEIADKIMILKNGENIAFDTPKNILLNYKNLEELGICNPQIVEILKLVNVHKKYVNDNIANIDEATKEIVSKLKNMRGKIIDK